MKNKILAIVSAGFLLLSLMGCGASGSSSSKIQTTSSVTETSETDTSSLGTASVAEETVTDSSFTDATIGTAAASSTDTIVRVGSLKGPTTIGLVDLMNKSDSKTSLGNYKFTMSADISEITADFVGGDLDIALVPANVASVLYNKTKGNVKVLYINTLGVLDCVTGNTEIKSFSDLNGKKILSTGQGATPEYVVKYLKDKYNVTCDIEFLSEPTEVAARLEEDPSQIAILPQPFVTVAETKNKKLTTAFSLSDAWDSVSKDSRMITGVTIVNSDFLKEHPDAVETFVKEAADSISFISSDSEGTTADLVAKYGIIEKAPLAKKAIPECNIVFMNGKKMKSALSGYLNILYKADPSSIGGKLPGEDFYY